MAPVHLFSIKKEAQADGKIVVLEDFEGEGEAVSVSLRALIGDKKSPKEKKEEEGCCGKHKKCNRISDARRIPKGGKK
ncbi:hypothetical protein HY839_02150 [Candidatus Azambacteria bacterium]|nr:hypothetical protein [Candidatus Azambacteria bacterium]